MPHPIDLSARGANSVPSTPNAVGITVFALCKRLLVRTEGQSGPGCPLARQSEVAMPQLMLVDGMLKRPCFRLPILHAFRP